MKELCLIIDFGSQYTQLIARKCRELQVYAAIVPPTVTKAEILKLAPKAVILSGGPSSVYEANAPKLSFSMSELNLPVLGICYGMQLMAKEFGGAVVSGDSREYGVDQIVQTKSSSSKLLSSPTMQVLMSHGDHVEETPQHFKVTARSEKGVTAVMEHETLSLFGIQFHPEVHHTPMGTALLQNFFKLSGFGFDWNPGHILEEMRDQLKAQVGKGRILCGVSGGVDSTVLAVVLEKLLPGQVECLCVDTGLLRKNEIENLKNLFEEKFHFPIRIVDASQEFLSELKGVVDPEQKRKIIGRVFIEIFERESKKLSDISFLAQGTLYPDVIESTSAHGGPTAKIKSHHNVGGLPERLPFKLVEPFRELFKDEVRRIGEFLGMPHEFVWRHPFPGPGLAVRVMGDVQPERLRLLREADARLQEVLKESGWSEKLWQGFCVYLPVKTVGVMGDQRTYEDCIAVRCVHSEDGMTAHVANLPIDVLQKISSRIINEVRGINRVVYDISSKPPSTIEWE